MGFDGGGIPDAVVVAVVVVPANDDERPPDPDVVDESPSPPVR